MAAVFLRHPGRSGPFGALMDEYARAAEDFCRVVDTFDEARFELARASNRSGHRISPCGLRAHLWNGAPVCPLHPEGTRRRFHRPVQARFVAPEEALRRTGLLAEAVLLMEETVEPLLPLTDEGIQALTFVVRWGPSYDPEMLLEHAVCHVLRHRRQLERW